MDYLQDDTDYSPSAYVYVAASSGDDANSGRSQKTPVKTLGRALDIWAAESSASANIMLLEDILQSYAEATASGLLDFSALLSTRPGIIEVTLTGSGSGKTVTNGAAANRSVLYINIPGKIITLQNLTITGGRGSPGGGIYINSSKLIIQDGVIISYNETNTLGGGLYVDGVGSQITMSGGIISGNKALTAGSGQGGGVYVGLNGSFTMENGAVKNNGAHNSGGGIYISGNAYIRQGDIGSPGEGNTANHGAGIYMGPSGILELGSSGGNNPYPRIQYNVSSGSGGGIVINDGSQTIFYHGTVLNNNGSSMGGGIRIVNGTLDMRGGTVTGNIATAGQGIVVEDAGTFKMSLNARALEPANPVYLYGVNKMITIGDFTGNYAAGIAVVTTNGYPTGGVVPVIFGSTLQLTTYYRYFNVDGHGFGTSLDSNGRLL
ncbi:MAG: hypothetical protein LBP60_00440 [Spirochaetaceae bacterium]|nr:hypothetical protein [Spirochaetaceae bacterium]